MPEGGVSLWELFLRGGWVMWPILLLSLVSLAVILERIFYFVFGILRTQRKFSEILGKLEIPNPFPGEEYWQVVIQREIQPFADESERGLYLLSAIATLAPLLGLLGTVTGMVRSFMVIERLGWEVDPALLAGGIWEALLTTVFGLIVAVPTLLAYYIFDAYSRRFIRKLEWMAMDKREALKKEKK
ncbi:MAG: MotA/TolQ/ExbB proton channel family protein [bacterium JZ-2024 1]